MLNYYPSKPIGSPKELSAMIRPFPKKVEIPGLMKQEAKEVIIYGPKNNIDFYFITPEKKMPEKKGDNAPKTNFKSIHTSSQSQEKVKLLEKLVAPKLNAIEKQALKEVRRKEGKLFLLHDIYYEISKDIEKKSKSDVKASRNKRLRLVKEEEETQVEELDRWEKNTIAARKLKEISNTPAPNGKGKNLSITLPSITASRTKLPPIEPSQVNIVEEAVQSRRSSSASMEKREKVEEEINEKESIANFKDGLNTPVNTSAVKATPDEGEDPQMDENMLQMVDVIEENEVLEEIKAEVQRMLEVDDDYEILVAVEGQGFSLKTMLDHYKEKHEKMEIRLAESISQLAEIIKENKEKTGDMMKMNQSTEKQARSLAEEIDILSEHNKRVAKIDDYGDYDEIDQRKADNEKEEKMREELQELENEIENQKDVLSNYDSECREYNGKMEFLKNLQKRLYRAIIHQGIDIREEGLIWVMRKLQELGEQATVKDFPVYLDQKSRKYLVEKLASINELKDLENLERKYVRQFKSYQERLVEQEVQFKSVFREDPRSIFNNSKHNPSFNLDIPSKNSINGGYGVVEGSRSSLKQAFRLEPINSLKMDNTDRQRLNTESPVFSPADHGSLSKIKVFNMTNSPGEENGTEGTLGSGEVDAIKTDAKVRKSTENEEIYWKAKILMRDRLKKHETELRIKSKIMRDDYSANHERIKLSEPFPNLSYNDRKNFLLKVQDLTVEKRLKQDRAKESLENEVMRIFNEYGKKHHTKCVGIIAYLSSMFGPTETAKYLNRMKPRGVGLF